MKLLDYSDMIKILFVFLALGAIYPALAQEWEHIQQLGGVANEQGEGLHINNDGHLYLSGSFEESLIFGDTTYTSFGEADAFLAKYDPEGSPLWMRVGGSVFDDQISAIVEDNNGNLICIGTYWLEASFENITLTTSTSPKAIFVLKYKPNGEILWGKSIDGTTLKEATDIVTDAQGNIFISGFYQDQLLFEDTTLTANGDSDLFVLKLNADGAKEWVYSEGYIGDTRAMSLALTSEADLIVGGFYNDTTRLGNFELAANTYDRDVFLARMKQSGEVLWAKRAGGVHDDEIVGLVLDDSDQIYVSGYLVGVMNLSEQLSIQSGNGNSDFYLLKYSPQGEVLQARAMGGNQVQQTTDIRLMGSQILLSGFYFGAMTIDNIPLNATGIVSGFAASFTTDNLQTNWIRSIDGDQTVVTNQIFADENGAIWLAGAFSGLLQLGNSLNSNGGFDAFFGPLPDLATNITEKVQNASEVRVYPNPTNTTLYIETDVKTYQVALINQTGQLVHSGKNLKSINIQGLPKGAYTILVNNLKIHFFEKIIIE